MKHVHTFESFLNEQEEMIKEKPLPESTKDDLG